MTTLKEEVINLISNDKEGLIDLYMNNKEEVLNVIAELMVTGFARLDPGKITKNTPAEIVLALAILRFLILSFDNDRIDLNATKYTIFQLLSKLFKRFESTAPQAIPGFVAIMLREIMEVDKTLSSSKEVTPLVISDLFKVIKQALNQST